MRLLISSELNGPGYSYLRAHDMILTVHNPLSKEKIQTISFTLDYSIEKGENICTHI